MYEIHESYLLSTSQLSLCTSRLALRTSRLPLRTSRLPLRTSRSALSTSQSALRTSQLKIRCRLERIRKQSNLDSSFVQTTRLQTVRYEVLDFLLSSDPRDPIKYMRGDV